MYFLSFQVISGGARWGRRKYAGAAVPARPCKIKKGIPHFDLWGSMEGQLTQITSSILRGWRGQNGEAYKNGVRLFST